MTAPTPSMTAALDAAARSPHDPAVWVQLAERWAERGQPGPEIDALQRAAALQPRRLGLRARLGAALLRDRQLAAALPVLRAAHQENPHDVASAVNLGECLRGLGELVAAEAVLRGALAQEPKGPHVDAVQWNLALCLRMAGKEAEGLRLYEARRRLPGFSIRLGHRRAWQGGAADRSIAVIAEQGLGDTLQHLGLVFALRQQLGPDAQILVLVQAPLVALARRLFETAAGVVVGALAATPDEIDAYIDEILGPEAPQVPLMSLPLCLGIVTIEERTAFATRIPADPLGQAQWSAVLEQRRRPGARLVGLCWQGNPAYPDDALRSVPLLQLVSLARDPRVQLVVLQQQHGRAQLSAWPGAVPLWDLAPELDRDAPFVDTASVLPLLDAVVTSDTSILHLAAAVGARTHALLGAVPDWRFGLQGSGWQGQPHVVLHRQRRPGDWSTPVLAIAAALTAEADAASAGSVPGA